MFYIILFFILSPGPFASYAMEEFNTENEPYDTPDASDVTMTRVFKKYISKRQTNTMDIDRSGNEELADLIPFYIRKNWDNFSEEVKDFYRRKYLE